MPVRLIAMDMDGTLLDGRRMITEETAAVLREAERRGIRLVFASGRIADDAACFAERAGISPAVIGLNGSVSMDRPGGEWHDISTFSERDALTLAGIAHRCGAVSALFGLNELVVSESRPQNGPDGTWGDNFSRAGVRCTVRYDSDGEAELCRAGLCKAVLVSRDEAVISRLRQEIAETLPDAVITSSWYDNLEINPRGVTKGSALEAMATRLGIPMSEVMAVGDNDNDLSMLRAAGIGVAMGNAAESVRREAGHVTLPCRAHGVAAAIRRFAFGEDVPGVS